jgi:glycolate oxidase subunit GlcD
LKDFSELINSLTNEKVFTDTTKFEEYWHDATPEQCQPLAIVFAENENDIIETVKFCNNNLIPIVVRGAGTGLSGGCVPSDGSIVLSLEKMTNLEIDSKNKIAFAQAGVITKTIMDEAEKLQLTYPPDPASYDESTIGGNIAENAGGLRCKRFGVTRDYVLGLKGITADGQVVETGIYNNNKGFYFGDLMTGSEGTLLIIHEISLKLIDLIEEENMTILIAFDNPKDAAQTVTDINLSGINTNIMEYLDGDAADCSNKYEKNEGLDNVAAILLLEVNKNDAITIEQICNKNYCSYLRTETDPQEAEILWKIRRNLSNAVKEIAKVRISEDVAVPNSKFPALVDFVAEMNKRSDLRINSFGHAGDGNLHVNFLGMTDDKNEMKEIEKNIEILLKKTIELGGTLTGEHGIGLAKKKYLHLEFNKSTIKYMLLFKTVFNPNNLLNPGKIFQKTQFK